MHDSSINSDLWHVLNPNLKEFLANPVHLFDFLPKNQFKTPITVHWSPLRGRNFCACVRASVHNLFCCVRVSVHDLFTNWLICVYYGFCTVIPLCEIHLSESSIPTELIYVWFIKTECKSGQQDIRTQRHSFNDMNHICLLNISW